MVTYARVKEILNDAVAAWEDRTGRIANLRTHDVQFGWATREQLLNSSAFGRPLIEDENISNQTGRDSNLVKALTDGVEPFPRMPMSGPFLNEDQIDEIVDWINGGAEA